MEAKTINRFEKAVKDINGRKVYRWLLHAKKASDSWLRKSITGDYCKLGKDWRKHHCCCSCSHTAFPGFCSWLLSEAGHGTGWPSRSTPIFLPSPQKSGADLPARTVPKRAELKSKLAQPQPPNPQLRARCKLWLSTALRQRHSLWIWSVLQKATLLWMEAGWTQAYLHPIRQMQPLLSLLWQTPGHTVPSPECSQCEMPPLLLQLDFISLKPRWPQLRAMWHQTVPETQRMELPSAHPPFYKRAIQFGKLSAFPASGHRSRGGLEPRPNGLDWDHVQHGAARAQSSHHGFECLNSKQRFGERGNESHWSEENPAPAFIFCLIPTNRAPTASTVCPEDWRAHIKSNFILLSAE